MALVARLLLGLAICLAVVPSAALAAPPSLDRVGQEGRHITASWSFASGNYASRYVQVASSPETDEVGFFPTSNQEDFAEVPPGATSWRSSSTFSPGTHFVHVMVENLDCATGDFTCETLEWSNVQKVVIPMPRPARATGLSVGHEDGRVTARWKLPRGRYVAGLIEVARKKKRKANGAFRDRSVVDYEFFERRARRWTSAYVGPGTYFVHVAAELKICGEGQDEGCGRYGWSKVVRVVVPGSEGPRHFKGRTSQGNRISFTIFSDRVTGMHIGYSYSCQRGSRSGSASLGSTVLSPGGGFSDHDDWAFSDGSTGDSLIRGHLRGPLRATGTFRFTTRGGINGSCDTGRVRWSAAA
jgi:hypothetical protein